MTIDERLDRHTERHEALTGHVEILTADLAQLTSRADDLTGSLAQLTSAVTRMEIRMEDLMTGFSTLVEIAKNHEGRIGRLEGR